MWTDRIYSAIVKTRYFLQACLLGTALYGCLTQAYAAYIAPADTTPLEQHSPDEIREAVVKGDLESLNALFAGKTEKFLQSYGLIEHTGLIGQGRYTYGFSVLEHYPGDDQAYPRSAIKAVEFKVVKGVVSDISFFGYQ